MMKRSFRDAWVRRLRSGVDDQTRGVLNRTRALLGEEENFPVGKCCLGVRAQQDVEDGLMETFVRDPSYPAISYRDIQSGQTMEAWPSDAVLTRWGLSEKQKSFLMKLNDTHKFSFDQVADYLDTLDVEED